MMTSRDELRERLLQPDVISGSEMLLRSLLLEDVECVFGYPGGSVLYIYDAIYDFAGLRHILARHEQGAIHAADGYARASGKTGVCIATSGPGATNLITGIAMAHKDNVPMVVITGNVPYSLRGTDAFQEADVIGMTLSITKHNYYITDVEDIPATVQAAFQIASAGRKGPVLVDIPKDISSHKKAFGYRTHRGMTTYVQPKPPDHRQIDAIIRELAKASKPLILCGEGVDQAFANRELLDFAEQANIPVALTRYAPGSFDRQHPLALGTAGTQGNSLLNNALRECDLLIVAGSRLDHRIEQELHALAAETHVVHLDDDDSADNGWPVLAGCYGDLRHMLAEAAEKLETVYEDWIGRLQAAPNLTAPLERTGFTAADVLKLVSDSVSSDVIVTVDEQLYQAMILDAFEFDVPRSLVCPVGTEGPGYSLPAAIGAKMAYPERMVICINGEFGIQKCTQELAVCAIHRIGLKIVVFTERGPSGVGSSPDFVKLAEAYGVKGWKAEQLEGARDVWAQAMKEKGPVLVEFAIERS